VGLEKKPRLRSGYLNRCAIRAQGPHREVARESGASPFSDFFLNGRRALQQLKPVTVNLHHVLIAFYESPRDEHCVAGQ
jgi:hypothetical protein